MFRVLWELNSTQINSLWLLIDCDGTCIEIASFTALKDELKLKEEKVIYTNSPFLCECLPNQNFINIELTEIETRYYLDLLATTAPVKNKPINPRFLTVMTRFHYHYSKLSKILRNSIEDTQFSIESFSHTVNWLSRKDIRVFPNEDIMDSHIYCTRWPGSHWLEFLGLGIVKTAPKRCPKTLKGLRTDPARVKFIDEFAFLLVVFEKITAQVDYIPGVPVWMSNLELKALQTVDSKIKFQIEDVLLADVCKLPEEINVYLTDITYRLSITLGGVFRAITHLFDNTWTMAFWASVERSRWITLASDIKAQYPFVLTGYGNGAMSFYCWQENIPSICEMLRVRASVIKQTEYSLNDLIKDQIEDRLNTYRYEDQSETEVKQIYDESYFNQI